MCGGENRHATPDAAALPAIDVRFRITPLGTNQRQSAPIEVERAQVAPVCGALRRGGVTRVRLQPVPTAAELLVRLQEHNLPALMRRQAW